MDVPALITIVSGAVIVALVFILRVPVILIGILAVILLGFTLYYHINLYSMEYRTMSVNDGLKSLVPIFMIGGIIIMTIGYLIMLKGGSDSKFKPSSIYGRLGSSYGPRYDSAAKPGLLSGIFRTATKPAGLIGKPSGSYRNRQRSYENDDDGASLNRREYISALDRLI